MKSLYLSDEADKPVPDVVEEKLPHPPLVDDEIDSDDDNDIDFGDDDDDDEDDTN